MKPCYTTFGDINLSSSHFQLETKRRTLHICRGDVFEARHNRMSLRPSLLYNLVLDYF